MQQQKIARDLKFRIKEEEGFDYVAKTKALISCAVTAQLICSFVFAYGMKHTVQEFMLHHDLLGVQIFHIIEKGLFIVQMIKSKANNVCMRGQDN